MATSEPTFMHEYHPYPESAAWPRFLDANRAARRYNIPLATFLRLVELGHLPEHNSLIGLWDCKALDAAFDRLSGLGSSENAYDAWQLQQTHQGRAR